MRKHLVVELTALPTLMKVGIVVLVLGALLDVLHHSGLGWMGDVGSLGHSVTFVGMVMTLSGVLIHAAAGHRSKPDWITARGESERKRPAQERIHRGDTGHREISDSHDPPPSLSHTEVALPAKF